MKIVDQWGIISAIAKRDLLFLYLTDVTSIGKLHAGKIVIIIFRVDTVSYPMECHYNCYHIFLSVATSVEGIASPAM